MRFFSFVSSCYLVGRGSQLLIMLLHWFPCWLFLCTTCLNEEQAVSSSVGSVLRVCSGKETWAGVKEIQRASFPTCTKRKAGTFFLSLFLGFQDQAVKLLVSGSIYEPFPAFRWWVFFLVRAKSLPSCPVSVITYWRNVTMQGHQNKTCMV